LGALFFYQNFPVPYETMQKSTVRVVISVEGNPVGHCSGVYLGDGKVLTAGHCNRGEEHDVHVSTYGSDEVTPAQWVKSTFKVGDTIPQEDLAVLKTEDLDIPAATVRCGGLSVGTKVYAAGHPKNLSWTVTKGTVTTLVPREEDSEGDWVQMDITIDQGNSGGPVFDRFGNLVGILSHSMVAGHGRLGTINSPHSYAASGEIICNYL